MKSRQLMNSWLLSLRLATTLALVCGLIACGSESEKKYQRKLVRVEPTSTPLALRGRPTPRHAQQPTKSSPTKTPKISPTAALQSPTPTPSPSQRSAALGPSGPKGLLVTTHTLGAVRAEHSEVHRIEGQGLVGCRVFLRRYGAQAELIPTRKGETVLEFRNLPLVCLERGAAYDLVVRNASGREWVFPEAVRVVTSPPKD